MEDKYSRAVENDLYEALIKAYPDIGPEGIMRIVADAFEDIS